MCNLLRCLCFVVCMLCMHAGFVQATPVAAYPPMEIMLGEMILVGFAGDSFADDAPVLQALRERKAGGVILFDREAETKNHVISERQNRPTP